VHAVHPAGFGGNGSGGGEGRDGEPADGPRQPAERIALVARMTADSGKAAGVQGLHQQRADPADQSGHVGMGDPWGLIGKVESRLVTCRDGSQPWRNATGIAGEEDPKTFRKVFLEDVVPQAGQD